MQPGSRFETVRIRVCRAFVMWARWKPSMSELIRRGAVNGGIGSGSVHHPHDVGYEERISIYIDVLGDTLNLFGVDAMDCDASLHPSQFTHNEWAQESGQVRGAIRIFSGYIRNMPD